MKTLSRYLVRSVCRRVPQPRFPPKNVAVAKIANIWNPQDAKCVTRQHLPINCVTQLPKAGAVSATH